MTSELIKIFTPTYKDTEQPDYRYKEDLVWIFNDAGHDVLNGLQKFKDEKQRIEFQFGKFAFQFTKSWLKRIEYIEENEGTNSLSITNRYKYRSKGLLKQLREKLNELGFNPSNVSKIIGAAKFSRTLETHTFDGNYDFGGSEEEDNQIRLFHSWAHGLPVRSLYVLNLMDRPQYPFSKTYSHLYDKSDGFKKDIPRSELEAIRKAYPKYDNKEPWKELPGNKFDVIADDHWSSSEQIIESQTEKRLKFIELLGSLDYEEAFVDEEFRQGLNNNHEHIETLKSWLPNRLHPSLSSFR